MSQADARTAAAHLLGVAPDADPDSVRRAFRRLVRDRHPDRAGPGPRAHDDTAALIAAYDLLRDAPPLPRPVIAETTSLDSVTVDALDDGTLVLAVPVDDAFRALVEAGHVVGEVTFIDPESGLFEILVNLGGRPCSVVVSLQGRMDSVEAWCTIDALDGGPRPNVGPVVAALAEALVIRPSVG